MKDLAGMVVIASFVLLMSTGVFSMFQTAPPSTDTVYNGPALNEGMGPGSTDYPPQYGAVQPQIGVGGGPPTQPTPGMCL